ncbi:hypothetical protein [Paraburkholderia madseniana]|uniref:hypothetical protein n=1 Tax=Paraburkholderia madseniana TaxID=2599607 RepID=UPI0015C56E50|nr:hypothetical protein [Paraburkholderia madseniana]
MALHPLPEISTLALPESLFRRCRSPVPTAASMSQAASAGDRQRVGYDSVYEQSTFPGARHFANLGALSSANDDHLEEWKGI